MKKIPVSILGATGSVGQKFIQLLENHPYFYITSLAASDRSAGKKYGEVVNWILPTPIPDNLSEMIIDKCEPNLNCKIVFSGLDSSVAGEIEENFAKNNYLVISNSKIHRFDSDVPLLIPEVNADHIELLSTQKFGGGGIITNPNCSTIGLAIALKPLFDNFEIEAVNVVTLQALSGAGYPGVSSLDIIDNVIPYISGEEEKIELEPKKIFGKLKNGRIEFAEIKISAQCNRVAVIDGHLESVQIKFRTKPEIGDIISAWENFSSSPQKLNLPSAPIKPIHYFYDERFPQPRLHRNLDKGMAVSIGRLRECSIFDYKFSILSHNTIRGAAGGAILCAELLVAKEYIR
ncbi:MAG: aspartate-semialdehyde dehydrogenase [Ignavibacteria bacterium]|nr:aspartate-semialdehyde dehydrogenase [Ignavibacteria bacterium]